MNLTNRKYRPIYIILAMSIFSVSIAGTPFVNFIFPSPANNSAVTNSNFVINLSSGSGEHYAFTSLDKSLVLWLRGDYRNGTNELFYDNSSYENNGTYTGETFILGNKQNVTYSNGKYGGAFWSDGLGTSNKYINSTASSQFNLVNPKAFTMSFWVWTNSTANPNGIGSDNRIEIISLTNSTTAYLRFQYGNTSSSNSQFYFLNATTATNKVCDYPLSSNLNKWIHFTVTGNSTQITCYVNGTLYDSTTTGPFASMYQSIENANFWLFRGSSSLQSHNGSIDNFIFFNRSLSAGEISEIYTNDTIPTDALLRYTFDDAATISDDKRMAMQYDDGQENTTGNRYGKGLRFDGKGDYINISSSNTIGNISNGFTFSYWMRANNGGIRMRPINHISSNFLSYLYGTAGENVYCIFTNNTGTEFSDAVTYTNSVGVWNMITCVYNGSAVIAYKNGVSSGSPFYTNPNQTMRTTINGVRIGSSGSTPAEFFNGTIDEVLIFNRTLSDAEIMSLYNASATQYQNNFTDLSEGNHTIRACAVNKTGERCNTSTITVDLTNPNLNLNSPIDFFKSQTGNMTFISSCNDTISGYNRSMLWGNWSGIWQVENAVVGHLISFTTVTNYTVTIDNFDSGIGVDKLFDSDYTTYAGSKSGTTSVVVADYNISPYSDYYNMSWEVKDVGGKYNLTVPNDCVKNYIAKFHYMISNIGGGWVNWSCVNQTSNTNLQLRYYTSNGAVYGDAIYIEISNTEQQIHTENNIPDGIWSWGVECYDNAGRSNVTLNRTFVVDTVNPVVSLGNPANNNFSLSSIVVFQISCTDTNIDDIQLWGNWSGSWIANITNATPTSGLWWNVTVAGIPEGVWNWGAYCNDSSGRATFSTNRTISIDTINPIISLGTNPVNNKNSSSSTATFEISCTDTNIDDIQLWGNWSGSWISNITNATPTSGLWWNVTVAGIPEGVWNWGAYCNDTIGRSVFSTNRTLSIDAIPPVITWESNSEIEKSYRGENKNSIFINISAVNVFGGIDYYNISLYNTTFLVNQTVTKYPYLNFTNLKNETYTIIATVNSSSGANTSSTKHTIIYSMIIVSPKSTDYYGSNTSINVSFSSNQTNISNAIYELDGINHTVTLESVSNEVNAFINNVSSLEFLSAYSNPENLFDNDYNTYSVGTVNAVVNINYTLNYPRKANSIIWRVKDSDADTNLSVPDTAVYNNIALLEIRSCNNVFCGAGGPFCHWAWLNHSTGIENVLRGRIYDPSVYEESIYYTYYNIVPFSFQSLIEMVNITTAGNHTLTMYANDTNNILMGSDQRIFEVDFTPPSINFVDVTTDTGNYSQNYIDVNVTSSDINVQNITAYLYYENGTLVNETIGYKNIEFRYANLGNHTYKINASVNDTAGNPSYTETRTINLDMIQPMITIHSPENKTYIGTKTLNLSVSSNSLMNLTSYVYSINDGTNYSFTPNTTIIISETQKQVIKVCGRDYAQNLNCTSLQFSWFYANYTITVMEEMTKAKTINVINTTSTLKIFCASETQEYNMTTNPLYDVFSNCTFEELRLTMIIDGTTHWRTLRPALETNVTFYMINTTKSTAVSQATSIYDVTNKYGNGNVKVSKVFTDGKKTMIWQNIDPEKKVTLYLIVGERYCTSVLDSNNENEVQLGCYYADTSTTKRLVVSTVPYVPETENIFEKVLINFSADKTTGSITAIYNDTKSNTLNLTFIIYNGTNTTQIISQFSTTDDYFEYTTFGLNVNDSYIIEVVAVHGEYGTLKSRAVIIFDKDIISGWPSEYNYYLSMAAALVVVFVMLSFGRYSAKVGIFVSVILMAFFYYQGWFAGSPQFTLPIIAIIAFIAVANVLLRRGNDK